MLYVLEVSYIDCEYGESRYIVGVFDSMEKARKAECKFNGGRNGNGAYVRYYEIKNLNEIDEKYNCLMKRR